MKIKIGKYIGADLQFRGGKKLNNINYLVSVGLKIIKHAKFNLRNISITQYDPFGLSIVFIISQSHIAFHTYPEHKYMQVEISTCGATQVKPTFDYMCSLFLPKKVSVYKRNIKIWKS